MESTYNPEVVAQQAYSAFLKSIEAPGERKRLAQALDVSEATVSRLISTHAQQLFRAAAHTRHTFVPVQEVPSPRVPNEVIKSLAVIAHHNLGEMVEQLNRE